MTRRAKALLNIPVLLYSSHQRFHNQSTTLCSQFWSEFFRSMLKCIYVCRCNQRTRNQSDCVRTARSSRPHRIGWLYVLCALNSRVHIYRWRHIDLRRMHSDDKPTLTSISLLAHSCCSGHANQLCHNIAIFVCENAINLVNTTATVRLSAAAAGGSGWRGGTMTDVPDSKITGRENPNTWASAKRAKRRKKWCLYWCPRQESFAFYRYG